MFRIERCPPRRVNFRDGTAGRIGWDELEPGEEYDLDERDLVEIQGATIKQLRGPRFILPTTSTRTAPLFHHQDEAIRRVLDADCSGILHMPTGAGKTRVAIELMARRLKADEKHRIIWASYPTGLMKQALVRICEMGSVFPKDTSICWTEAGFVDGEFFEDDRITLLMRDDLTMLLDAAARGVKDSALLHGLSQGLSFTIIFDECHYLGAKKLRRAAKRFLDRHGAARGRSSPHVQVVGLSATPLPTSAEARAEVAEHIFPIPFGKEALNVRPEWGLMVHHTVTIQSLVEQEILCPVDSTLQDQGVFDLPEALVVAATKGVAKSKAAFSKMGDFERGRYLDVLNRAVMESDDILAFLSERIGRHLPTLGKTIVFVPTIRAANRLVSLLKENRSVGAGNVTLAHSKLDEFDQERAAGNAILEDDFEYTDAQKQIAAFQRRGAEPCVMVNVGMLTTGFDDPKIQTVVLARKTQSVNLFWQMIGRGTRGLREHGTSFCYVIDPLRLGERFGIEDGYLPNLKAFDARASARPRSSDGALAPAVPVRTGVPASSEVVVDPKVRDAVAETLRAFLRGDITREVPKDATTTLQGVVAAVAAAPDGTLQVHFVKETKQNVSTHLPATAAVADLRFEAFRREVSQTDPKADVMWLRSNRYWPKDASDQELHDFLHVLDVIKRSGLHSEEAFRSHMLSALRAHAPS